MKSSGEHRRGRSMGSAPPATVRSGEKDEDLALFHEMKRREKHNFLHPSPDDLDATLSSKFGGMGAPTKKPGTDLLTSESDKNDYDWLLTPPGTPLFPSLDQEAAALAVLSPALSNGSYSSASSATKSLKSSTYSPAESVKGSRGNPSPRRQVSTASPSPNGISRSRSSPSTAPTLTRPSTPTSTGGTRPSTPTSKSSTPTVRSSTPNLKLTISHSSKSYSNVTTPTGTRPSTPTPRSSTPPVRPSTPGGRSSTPTSKPSTPIMRRSLSGGRTGITSPSPTTTRGGPSPKRTTSSSRGNSPSAKRITSVITSIAGMSSEAPPNLRTTMPERSSSTGKSNYSNGSRIGTESGHHNYNNNMEESAQNRRRPRSPSVARSFSSSSSQEQRTSSQTSRGSVISSYDDGLEVNRPSSMGSNRNSSVGKWHAAGHEELMTGKANAYGKRETKSSVTSRESSGYGRSSGYGGTPTKRSSDMVKRPVDAYQNSPTTAYRHLHSSSPASPFYSTRTNSLLLRAGVAMNSSMTTSSNASSEHGTTVAADTEGSERDEDDLLSWDSYGRRASMSPRLQQADILVLDKDDEKTVPWQDSLFERANSHGPSSSHSQGSQSTLDAEVTGFYETDGTSSLEMLEQLGLLGESYQLKKSSPFRGRSSETRTSSTEDVKAPNFRTDEYGHSRISPHKVFHERQGSPARHLAHLEKQESLQRPRKSRDFDSKILPPNLIFQENHGSPARHFANLVRQEEISERPRKTRDFESKSSPRRLSLESQGSPARHLAQLEMQDSLERPRRSRDFESKSSPRRLSLESRGSPARNPAGPLEKQEISERPRRLSLESQGSPARHPGPLEKQAISERPGRLSLESQGSPARPLDQLEKQEVLERPRRLSLESQGSPARHPGQLEKQDSLERPRRSRDFETELLKRNGEKSVGSLEPQAPNSEIRAACLFVRDFKVGLSSPHNLDAPLHTQDNSPGVKKHGIEEMEMKLRNELSYDWDNSVDAVEEPVMDFTGDIDRKLSDSPLHVSLSKTNVVSPESAAHLSLEFPFTTADDSLVTPEISTNVGAIDRKREDVDLTHHISMNGTPASKVIENPCVNDGMMDESETESPQPKEVDMDYPAPSEGIRPSATVHSMFDLQKTAKQDSLLLTSQLLGIQSDLSDDGVYAMDEDTTEMPTAEDDGLTASQSEEESVVLEEECKEGGHVPVMEKQHSNPMDVDEDSISVPENQTGKEALGGVDERFSQAEIQQGTANGEEPDIVQSSEEDAVREGLYKIQRPGADQEQGVVEEELDGMWYSEADNQKDVVESFLHAVPFSVGNNGFDVVDEKKLLDEEDERDTITVGADGMHASEKQIEQVHSNGNHLIPSSECAVVLEKESICDYDVESVLGNVRDDQGPQELQGRECQLAAVDINESSPWNLHASSDAIEDNEESALYESYDSKSVDHAQNDVVTSGAELEGTQDHVAEVVDIKATQGIVKEASVCLSNHQVQEESQSLEYFDADCVTTVDDTIDEVSSNLSNHLLQEELQSPKSSISDSMKELHYLSDANDDKDFLPKDIGSLQSPEESPKEDIDVFRKKLSEFDARVVENEQMPYGSTDGNKISSHCEPKPVDFVDKHPEMLDLSPSSENISEVQPPIQEFRSASTLCAALEEQIAGLIQKIDSAIEESSKPFSASPQESLLVKDKRSILEPDEDDFAGSMRPSQEEDLLDMLWAEDDETTCSEGSRDQDNILNSKDCSQREMNGVRSCRLSDRVLPISFLGGQSNDAYDAMVRSSRSDLGVEKRMLDLGSSKRIAVSPADQQDDVVLMHNREAMKSPVKSPLLWSKELNIQNYGLHHSVPEDARFHLEAQSQIDKSSGEGGSLSNPDEELRTESFGQEYASDSLTESSSYDDVEDMKTDAELLSLCKVAEPVCDSDILANSSAVLVSAKPDSEMLEYEVPLPEETIEGHPTSSEKSSRVPGESSEAAQRALPDEDVSREVEMSNIVSNGDTVTLEGNDQVIQELAHNRDRDESSILLTSAPSEVSSKIVNGTPNDEWLHRESMLPEEETSSEQGPSTGHVAEEPVMELKEEELQSFKEPEIWEDSPCPSLTSDLVDPNLVRKGTQGESSVLVDHFVRDDDFGCVQGSERVQDVHPLRQSPQHEVSSGHFNFGLGAIEEPESLSGRDIRDGAEVMLDTNGTIMESTQLPESDSRIVDDQHTETNADAEVKGEDLLTPQGSPQGRCVSLSKLQISPRGGAVGSHSRDEISWDGAVVLPESRMVQGSPGTLPGNISNGSGGEVQIQKWKSNEGHTDSWKGQHIANKISRAERESFRMEGNDSGIEPGIQDCSLSSGTVADMIVRKNMSTEAHVSDEVQPQESETRLKGEGIAEGPATEGHQEVTKLSVLSELPALNSNSPRIPAACKEEMKANDEILGLGANGNGDLGTAEDKDSRVGNQSVRRLPSNKAKSVRTISLGPRSQTDSPSEEPSSPEEVYTPQKPNAYTNITVISPESLQWDRSSPAVETPTKARISPASLSRNMTLAEATDTILYCSSLMHTIVYKAAAYAIEKEELTALASTPTSNGEVAQNGGLSEVVNRVENASEVGEAVNCKSQVVNTGPPSVRRALSYMGHQTVPLTPADTSLQIPVDQVIDMKALEVTAPTATEANQKDDVMPVKVSKAKCGCTIM